MNNEDRKLPRYIRGKFRVVEVNSAEGLSPVSSCVLYDARMSDSFLDHLPGGVRERIQKRMRSPAEYAALREKVKGPEDLEREMEKNDALAELKFALETEPALHDALKASIERDVREHGMENVMEIDGASPESKKAMERGAFMLKVSSRPSTHQDALVAVPEGSVQETIPLKPAIMDRYVAQLQKAMRGTR